MKQDKVTFTPRNAENLFVVYELDTWSRDLNSALSLKNWLFFGFVKLAKSPDSDKCSYSEYDIGFDSRSLFSFPNFDWGKNVVILGVQ